MSDFLSSSPPMKSSMISNSPNGGTSSASGGSGTPNPSCFASVKKYISTSSFFDRAKNPVLGFLMSDIKGEKKYHKSRVIAVLEGWKGRDALIKAGTCGLNLFALTLEKVSEDPEIDKGAHSMHKAAKDARTVFSLVNAIAALKEIPKVIHTCVRDLSDVIKGKPLSLSYKTVPVIVEGEAHPGRSYKKVLTTKFEKVSTVAINFIKIISTLAYTVAFGICRPISFVDSHFKGKISASARAVGSTFSIVMLVNNFGEIIKSILMVIRDHSWLSRSEQAAAVPSGNLDTKDSLTGPKSIVMDGDELQAAQAHVRRETALNILNGLEKGGEGFNNISAVCKLPIPPIATAAIGLAAALVGVYRAWKETEYSVVDYEGLYHEEVHKNKKAQAMPA